MAEKFSDILDRAPSEIERPKPLPQGTYRCMVDGLYEEVTSGQKGTPGVKFKFKIISSGEDVDEDALKEWMTKADGSTRTLADASLSTTYWLTEGSAFMLKEFLTNLGVIDESYEGSMRAALADTPNREIDVYVKHKPTQDGKGFFAEVGSTAKVD